MRVLVLLACAGCSTYVEHRAALVPHAAPVQNIGQPNEHRVGASVGASNIVDLAAPTAGDPNAGVAIPSRQLRGSLLLAITRNLTLGFVREHGLASSAQPVKSTLPPLDGRSLVGGGATLSYSFETGSPWRIGLSLEILGWSAPYVEYSTCIDFCGGDPYTIVTRDTTAVMTAGLGIVPSYRFQDWTFFGGVTARNHPTIEEKVISNGFSTDVEDGPFNAIIHGGVAYNASDRVRFVVEMHQTVTRDPVVYAPGIGFSVEVGIGPRMPKPVPRPIEILGPPGNAAPLVGPSPEARRAEAEALTREAHEQAKRGECEQVRALDARVHALDAEYHATVFLSDKLIAYCVMP